MWPAYFPSPGVMGSPPKEKVTLGRGNPLILQRRFKFWPCFRQAKDRVRPVTDTGAGEKGGRKCYVIGAAKNNYRLQTRLPPLRTEKLTSRSKGTWISEALKSCNSHSSESFARVKALSLTGTVQWQWTCQWLKQQNVVTGARLLNLNIVHQISSNFDTFQSICVRCLFKCFVPLFVFVFSFRVKKVRSDKLHKLPLLCSIVRAQHFKQKLHCPTVVGVAVVWPATLH